MDLTKRENALTEGLAHMQDAHRMDPKHPVVLNMLANHFFLTREFEKVFIRNWLLLFEKKDQK